MLNGGASRRVQRADCPVVGKGGFDLFFQDRDPGPGILLQQTGGFLSEGYKGAKP